MSPFRYALAPLVAIFAGGAAFAAADPGPKRQAELLYLLEQDCGSCHGLTLKGGLGPPLLPQDLAGKDADGLVDTILYGRPGTPMPPWHVEISREEATWLVQRLLKGNVGG